MNKKDKLKGFKALVKKIEKSNEKFSRGTQAQRIVMVAQDVLNLIDLGRAKPTHGTYFSVDTDTEAMQEKLGDTTSCQLSDLLKMPELPACHVCAIGGAMLASTLRLNAVTVDPQICVDDVYDDYETGDTMSARANEVFPTELLRAMEDAFESGYHGYGRLKTAEGKLRAIYQNLVDNKGKCFTRYRSQQVVYPEPQEEESDLSV